MKVILQCLIILCSTAVLAFQAEVKPFSQPPQQSGLFSEFDKIQQSSAAKSQADIDLSLCNQKVQEWQDWYDKGALPEYRQLQNENLALKRQVAENKGMYFNGGFGLVIGVFVVGLPLWLVVRYRKRLWPSTPAKKQLMVLLLMAVWMSICFVVGAVDSESSGHAFGTAIIALLYSLPALLFGGTALWWMSRKPQ